ncbi:MAG: hypothetical protein HQ488_02765 [Parcubacteria group bacterium]|nr:hypothetical protein [Parcubacteria group bacterium]
MTHPDTEVTVLHVARVSIRDQLTSTARRKEVQPDFDFASSQNIALVELTTGGQRVPAAVGLRTTLTGVTPTATRTTYSWHVTLSPFTDGLLRRLFAERNKTAMAPEDAPLPDLVSARYDAVAAIDAAHKPLCELRPEHIGTHLQMVFAIRDDLTRCMAYSASEIAAIKRAHDRANRLNDVKRRTHARAQELWQANHIFMFGRQLWPMFKKIPVPDVPTLRPVPEIPALDRWTHDAEHYMTLGDVVARDFAPVLESLWKATFAQDDYIAAQLGRAGYKLGQLDATRMGFEPLRQLMEGYRDGRHMTMVGSMDLLDDLGPEHIAAMTVGAADE